MAHSTSAKLLLLCLLLVSLGAKPGEKEKRVALVIGNGAYQGMTRLANPPQDSRDVGRKLESLGFAVTRIEDQSKTAMERAVEEFAKQSRGARVAILYYSGHGIQVDGRNYLIPVDAETPDDESGMHRQAVELEWIVEQTTKSAKVSLIFMDACRNNPGLDRKLPSKGKDVLRDVRLATVPRGMVQVLYAASKGQRALDSVGEGRTKSRNSPFAEALLSHLSDRDAVQLVVAKVIRQVKERTKGEQQPEQQGNVDEELYLAGKIAPLVCPSGSSLVAGACQPLVNKTCEGGLHWEELKGCVPNIVAPIGGIPVEQHFPAETTLRPKMVWIPAGGFWMGSPREEGDADEHPQHKVELTRSFWMSETEVTLGQYEQTVKMNPSSLSTAREAKRHPVVNVSWNDAVMYCNKLSERTGLESCYEAKDGTFLWPKGTECQGYRLPTEAEWEYAAKAGKETRYVGGNDPDEVAWYADNAEGTLHEVGSKDSNRWGLYDMNGNVYEWVWDRSGNYPSTKLFDPTGASVGLFRITRGGAWTSMARNVRSAHRHWSSPNSRSDDLGLRIVRSVLPAE